MGLLGNRTEVRPLFDENNGLISLPGYEVAILLDRYLPPTGKRYRYQWYTG
jgi:hypothetical protein